jgi:hypothetical protein
MKNAIDSIFYDLKHELITEEQAHQQVMNLFTGGIQDAIDPVLQRPQVFVTDEDIWEEALKRRTTNTDCVFLRDAKWFARGAKWMRLKLMGK